MTVIRGKKIYSYPKPNSAAGSDTESLHLGSVSASDTESLNNEPITSRSSNFRPLPVRLSHVEELISLKKCSGRKKLRRYQNRCVLQTLSEEEENDNAVVIIVESYKSPFTRLLEDPDALEYWNTFIEKPEDEQKEIMKAFSERNYKKASNQSQKPEKPIGKISSKIKHSIKIKKNLSLETVKDYEDNLLEFFKSDPKGVYVKCPPTGFDCLLFHAIAQYHNLKSTSLANAEDGSTKHSIEVFNTDDNWVPARCFLADFIQELRQ